MGMLRFKVQIQVTRMLENCSGDQEECMCKRQDENKICPGIRHLRTLYETSQDNPQAISEAVQDAAKLKSTKKQKKINKVAIHLPISSRSRIQVSCTLFCQGRSWPKPIYHGHLAQGLYIMAIQLRALIEHLKLQGSISRLGRISTYAREQTSPELNLCSLESGDFKSINSLFLAQIVVKDESKYVGFWENSIQAGF